MTRYWLIWMAVGALIAAYFLSPTAAHAASDVWFPNVCGDLRNGMPLTALETVLTAQGYSEYAAGAFTGDQIKEHCPDMKPVVLGQIR